MPLCASRTVRTEVLNANLSGTEHLFEANGIGAISSCLYTFLVRRVASGGEGTFGANAGLPTVALKLLQPITDKYVGRLKAISHADLWALAANVAIEHMGGPKIPTRFGRKDASSSAESVESQVGRLPDGDKVLRVEKAQRLSPCSRLESTHWASPIPPGPQPRRRCLPRCLTQRPCLDMGYP